MGKGFFLLQYIKSPLEGANEKKKHLKLNPKW